MELTYRSLKSHDELIDQAVRQVVTHLKHEISKRGEASLFLSGGSTPGPVYETLSTVSLPWDKVSVGMVDERWVDEDDTGSNAALVRRSLLKANAKAAHFVPMKTDHDTPQAGQDAIEAAYGKILSINSLAVLGMGTDGHVCSWFPDAEGLGAALNPKNKNAVQAITALRSDVTGKHLDRMTLTYSAIKKCKSVLLLITGAEKKAVLEKAFEQSQSGFPVANLLQMDPVRLTILHAP